MIFISINMGKYGIIKHGVEKIYDKNIMVKIDNATYVIKRNFTKSKTAKEIIKQQILEEKSFDKSPALC